MLNVLLARRRSSSRLALALATVVMAAAVPPCPALEYLDVADDSGERRLAGRVVIEARDGLLMQTADGAFHRVLTPTIRNRTKDSLALEMLDADQLAEKLLAELPPGFQVHQSKNYVVCYNTTLAYAKWTSSLLERLQRAFIAHWKKHGCAVAPSKTPLVVLVFSDQQSYAAHAREELGAAVNNVIGYYNLDTNRITMYDLTGMQAVRREGNARGSIHDINDALSTPAAEPLVATIVHEATHQISFNCGLQTRLVDNPLWMSEGLAVFFETPDLSSSRTWSGIKVNYSRWDRFVANYDAGLTPPLERLVADDELFRDPNTAVDSYAQAWAWNYFLIKWHPEEYAAYLKTVAAGEMLAPADPKKRLADFRKHFGADLDALEDDFYRRMQRIE
jgi:hypothetical protein